MALNEKEPEEIVDTLEPDYDGLRRFDQVLGRFRGVFYDGAKEDPACAEKKSKGPANKGKSRPNPNKKVYNFSSGHSQNSNLSLSKNQSTTKTLGQPFCPEDLAEGENPVKRRKLE